MGAVIGALSAVVTTFLLLLPNLGASTENQAEIRKLVVEPNVTLEKYFQHRPVSRSLHNLRSAKPKLTAQLEDLARSRFHVRGSVLHFEVELKGLRDVEIQPRWSVFDGDTGERLVDSEHKGVFRDPLPFGLNIQKKDADSGTWEIWVDTSGLEAKTFVVRLELYDERSGARITFQDSERFPAPRI